MAPASPLKKIPVGEVLRLMFNDAGQRVAQTKPPKTADLQSYPPTPRVRELQREHRRNVRANARIERQIKKRGYGIYSDGRLYVTGTLQAASTATYTKSQAERHRLLKQWRVDAHLDLVGLPVEETRTYLRALRTKLEAL